MKLKNWILCKQEDGESGGSGAGGEPAPAASADDGKGAASAEDKSLMASMAGGGKQEPPPTEEPAGKPAAPVSPEQAALKAAEKDVRRPAHIPAKFWDHEKGEIRVEAMAKSNSELEARMKNVGLPPKSSDEYAYEAPEQFKAIIDAGFGMEPDVSKAIKDKLLEAGITKSQHGVIMDLYYQEIQGVADLGVKYGADRLQKQLSTFYKTPEATQQAVNDAFEVVKAFGDEEEINAAMGPEGNTPPWVYRVLAKVRKELGEDKGISNDSILTAESLDELMRGGPGKDDSPYWNPQHPQHKSVVAKVQRHHEAAATSRQRKAA